MRFVIDLDLLQVISAATDKRAVVMVEGKRGDDSPFEVTFVRSGTAEELAASSVLTFGAKQSGKYDAAAVVLNSDFTLTGSGTTAKYTGNPSFNTEELNALFLIDADDSNDPAYVDLMAEFTWQIGAGAPSSTKTFAFRVHNDIVRDSELSPVAVPPPIGATAPVNCTLETAFSGTNNDIVCIGADFSSLVINAPASPTPTSNAGVYNSGTRVITITIGSPGGGVAGTMTGNTLITRILASGVPPGTTAVLASGNDGSGNVVAGTYNFTAGTVTPPFIRVAGGFLYIQESGLWKKTALSAL